MRYALLPLKAGEVLGSSVRIPTDKKTNTVRLLASGATLEFAQDSEGIVVSLPEEWRGTSPLALALALA